MNIRHIRTGPNLLVFYTLPWIYWWEESSLVHPLSVFTKQGSKHRQFKIKFFEIVGWMESTMIKNLTKHSIACTWNLFTESEFHINKDLFLASCSNLRCFFRFLRPVNSFSHVSQWNRTWKHWLSSPYAGFMWCFSRLKTNLHSSY